MEIIFSLPEIEFVAQKILNQKPKKVILFNGEMGVGKTTLIKKIAQNLGVKENLTSPTFSIVNEHALPNGELLYHFDCYRLKTETEALDMGIDEYLDSNHWCFIEWAEKIENLLPELFSTIDIQLLEDGKRLLKLV